MLMVKSANDIAVTIAEGVSGSVEAFADEMNRASAQLGMHESYWVNPNGLPDSRQVTSARDLAILGRALYLQFPEYAGFFNIGAMQLGGRITPTHNGMLGRYPGADGMKTGFTCPAGFNLVASATHGGTRLIAVVLGAPSASARTAKTAALLDRAFHTGASMGSIDSLPTLGVGAAPDMRDSVCRHRGKATAEFLAGVEDMTIPVGGAASTGIPLLDAFGGAGAQQRISVKDIARIPRPYFEPVRIYVGRAPGYQGPVARARAPGAPIGAEPDLAAYAQEQNETGASPISQAAPDATPLRRQTQSKLAQSKLAKGKLAKGKRGQHEATAEAPEKPAKPDAKASAKKAKPQGKDAAIAQKDGKKQANKGKDGKAKAGAANKSAGQDLKGKDAKSHDAKSPAKAPGGRAKVAQKPGQGQ
jgi:D-alanyl-D-alanine carboxypeptidase